MKKAFDTYRFVRNNTLAYIKAKNERFPKWKELRNIFVTEDTKTTSQTYLSFRKLMKEKTIEINSLRTLLENNSSCELLGLLLEIESLKDMKKKALKETQYVKNGRKSFEMDVHKDIRTCAVKELCDNYKTLETNLKLGNIKFYNVSYMKKNNPRKTIKLDKNLVKMVKGEILINLGKCQEFKGFGKFKISYKNKKKYSDIEIKHDVSITRFNNKYFMNIPVSYNRNGSSNHKSFCGVDPGVRTLMTVYSSNGITEYKQNDKILKKLKDKIDLLKSLRVRKKQISKYEKKTKDVIDLLHWSCINDLVSNNDIIYFGDIKSHGIVKNSKNRTLNRNMMELKLFLFKQRLAFKAFQKGKKVVFINEFYTSKCCSKCGELWHDLGSSKTFYCQNKKCRSVFDRDINAAKNICMKGILLDN